MFGTVHNMTERTTYIYALRDPRDGQVYYVGKSNSPRSRYLAHLDDKDTNVRKAAWIDDLAAVGLKPQMDILEAVPLSEWRQAERRWIGQGIAEKWPLTNISAGGGGMDELPTVYSWTMAITDYLMPHERPLFAALSEDKQFAVCHNTAKAMMYLSWIGIKMRGGDPQAEYNDHRQFWHASRVARTLVHRMAA